VTGSLAELRSQAARGFYRLKSLHHFSQSPLSPARDASSSFRYRSVFIDALCEPRSRKSDRFG
jgi:hypothetical protein